MLKTFEVAPRRYMVEALAFEGEPPVQTTVADSASAMSIYVERLDEMDEMDDSDDPDFLGVVRILRRSGGGWQDVTDWCIDMHQKAGKYLYL